uniref:Uncharacterized protein n=1 Tax=Populus trichocarpa x Populus deltoides TaxID=3695 RepID=A9PJ13_9ROSI|nr:unknown [Populus trichocarpa x Populus deltoides]
MKGFFLQCPGDLLLRIPGMTWRLDLVLQVFSIV